MSPYAKRITCNERMYPRSNRNTLDPDEDDKRLQYLQYLAKGNIKQTLSDTLCKLFQLQAAPEIEMKQFEGNPLNYHYFYDAVCRSCRKKDWGTQRRLTRLIKFKSVEARELINHSIQLPHSKSYQHGKALLERTYGNPHKILPSYWKEIKEWSLLKLGDTKSQEFITSCWSVNAYEKVRIGMH